MKTESFLTPSKETLRPGARCPGLKQSALRLAAMATVAVSLWCGCARDKSTPTPDSDDSLSTSDASSVPNAETGVLRLSDEKILAAGLQTSIVEVREIQDTRTVPGRLRFNDNHHLDVTAPVQGSVRLVDVQSGQQVKRGDVLAVISSAEIGTARSEVLRRKAELRLAEQQLKWADEIALNLTDLLSLLAGQPEVAEVEKTFARKLLGDYRDDILAAYSKLKLAESVSTSTAPLGQQGFISGRVARQRRSDREVAAVSFQSECEQLRLDCRQRQEKARAATEDARRLLTVSQEHLSSLSGTSSEDEPGTDDESLNDLTVRAPIDGEVVRRMVVAAARVEAADSMFLLARTDKLWVSAEMRESDLAAVSVEVGQQLDVHSATVPNQSFSAQVRFVGAEVSPQTRALPVVAALVSSHDRLKPGMFVWVTFPAGAARNATAVPPGAVMSHEGQAFLFVQQDRGTYRRQDVDVGLTTPDWVEIRQGLSAEQRVVDRGAFFLKSESLLEGEEE